MNTVNPAGWLVVELVKRRGQSVIREELHTMMASVTLTQVQAYSHGSLIPHTTTSGRVFYEYRSESGYVGKDQAIFMAEFEGKRYKIVANVVVSWNINENDPQCHEPKLIKITKPCSGFNGNGVDHNDPASVSLSFANLPTGTLGQTTGPTITLDDNAAGHGWFIDYTPYLNEEFLPTSVRNNSATGDRPRFTATILLSHQITPQCLAAPA